MGGRRESQGANLRHSPELTVILGGDVRAVHLLNSALDPQQRSLGLHPPGVSPW